MWYNLFMGVNEMCIKNITVTVSVRVSVTVRVSLVWCHWHFLFRKICKWHWFSVNWDSAKWGRTTNEYSVRMTSNNCWCCLLQTIFQQLCSLDVKGNSYILEASKNPTKVFDCIAQLLAHPLQRPLQHDLNYSLLSNGSLSNAADARSWY